VADGRGRADDVNLERSGLTTVTPARDVTALSTPKAREAAFERA
jgi:hypothetical protein